MKLLLTAALMAVLNALSTPTPPPNPTQIQTLTPMIYNGTVIRQYSRGLPTLPTGCNPMLEFSLGLCYSPCQPGFEGRANICVESCPQYYADVGPACMLSAIEWKARNMYVRGVGELPLNCGSTLDQEKDEKDSILCYPKCANGYEGKGPFCFLKDPQN